MSEAPSTGAGADISGRAYLGLVGIGAAIGIPAALVAALFLAFVHVCQDWLWTDLPQHLGDSRPPWYLVIGLPVVGAAIVWAARRYLPGDGGHKPLLGIVASPTPWQYGPGIAIAALGTLVFGAVLGPEGPLIALGSVVGVTATHFVRVNERAQAVLATAGSFSAVSALFEGPLVAGMLLLEGGVGMGAALIPALLPGLVAAAVGYVLFIGLGNWGGLHEAGLKVGDLPLYQGTHIVDLLLAIVVGILAAILMAPIRRLGIRVASAAPASSRGRMAGLLLAGGLAVGLLAEVARLLGANSQEILFSGQASVPEVIAQDSTGILVVIVLAKALGYAISLGCGFRGGAVFPALFLGIAIATFAVTWFNTSPTWAVAVGCAAGMTAGTGLLFSSLIFAMLLVGSNGFDALPAAVLAAAAAWIVRRALEARVPTTGPAAVGGAPGRQG